MLGIQTLANYSVVVKLWLSEETVKPLIYSTTIILNNNLQTFVLRPTDKCSLYLSSRKLLFATEETAKENHNLSQFRIVEPIANGYIYKTLPSHKAK